MTLADIFAFAMSADGASPLLTRGIFAGLGLLGWLAYRFLDWLYRRAAGRRRA